MGGKGDHLGCSLDPAGGSAPDPRYRLALRAPMVRAPPLLSNFTPMSRRDKNQG